MQNKLISIIVPVYNVENYLETCIESLLKQKYKEFEILLIDDGSTDKSGEICDRYCDRYPFIKVFHQENAGQSKARNIGIKQAKGYYICFVDSDDYVDEFYLQVLYSNAILQKCPIVECGSYNFRDGDINLSNFDSKTPQSRLYSAYEWLTESGVGDFLNCALWNKIYEKSLFDDISFPEGRIYEDEATIYKLVYKSQKVFRIYQRLYFYRIRSNSTITSNISPKKLLDQINCLKERADYFERLHETELADFSYAKHCISLISSYRKYGELFLDVYNKKSVFLEEVSCILKRILFKKVVPLRYTVGMRISNFSSSLIAD